jgi:hypothetical protein
MTVEGKRLLPGSGPQANSQQVGLSQSTVGQQSGPAES